MLQNVLMFIQLNLISCIGEKIFLKIREIEQNFIVTDLASGLVIFQSDKAVTLSLTTPDPEVTDLQGQVDRKERELTAKVRHVLRMLIIIINCLYNGGMHILGFSLNSQLYIIN